MPENNTFRGAGVALVTPFNDDNQVDIQALQRITEHVIQGGIDYLVALGTTAETSTLTAAEKKLVLEVVLEVCHNKVPVVAGLGGNNTVELVQSIRQLPQEVSAVLSVSPYYNRPTQEGLYQHYAALAEASPLPIILYNVPSRTASNLSAATTLRIARDFKNVIGIKEASGDLVQSMHLIQERQDGFLVISGDDLLTLPLLAIGADGLISVMANAMPGAVKNLVQAGLDGNFQVASIQHYRLLKLIEALFEEGNPAGIKMLMKILGICGSDCRLPLLQASPSLQQKLEKLVAVY